MGGEEGDRLLVHMKITVPAFAAPRGRGGGSQHPVVKIARNGAGLACWGKNVAPIMNSWRGPDIKKLTGFSRENNLKTQKK